MQPKDLKKIIDKAVEDYQVLKEENIRLKYTNDKLKEELLKMKKLTNNNLQYGNNYPVAVKQNPKIKARGCDYTIEENTLAKLILINKLKYKAPISNIKVNKNCVAFSCNKKIFVRISDEKLQEDKVFMCTPAEIIEFNPHVMKTDLSEFYPCTFEWYKDRLICVFETVLVQYDLEKLQIMRKSAFKPIKHIHTSFDNKLYIYTTSYNEETGACSTIHELKESEDRFVIVKEYNAPVLVKSFVKYSCSLFVFIKTHAIGSITEEGVSKIKTTHMNSVLFLHRNSIYIGGETSALKIFLVNNDKHLEQVDVMHFNKGILGLSFYLNTFLVVVCAEGINHFYHMDTKKTMKLKTSENAIGIGSYQDILYILEASGELKKFTGTLVHREKKKILQNK